MKNLYLVPVLPVLIASSLCVFSPTFLSLGHYLVQIPRRMPHIYSRTRTNHQKSEGYQRVTQRTESTYI
jgi:hypothetical protein